MNDLIQLNRAQTKAFAELAGVSALHYCTTATETPHGTTVLTKNWPALSTGEEILWDALAALVVGKQPSTENFHRLDRENRAIAERAIEKVFGVAS